VLLLQSPFSSARAMARLIVTLPVSVVWRVLSRIHFDTVKVVSDLDVPVSVVHGRNDRIIPFRMGVKVTRPRRERGKLLLVEGAGHNDVAEVGGKAYWNWVFEALDAHSK